MAIAPADEIRRRAFFAVHLGDHSLAVLIAYIMSLDGQLITGIEMARCQLPDELREHDRDDGAFAPTAYADTTYAN